MKGKFSAALAVLRCGVSEAKANQTAQTPSGGHLLALHLYRLREWDPMLAQEARVCLPGPWFSLVFLSPPPGGHLYPGVCHPLADPVCHVTG